jgi:diacylglycerol kinase (ATP)
MSEKRYAVIVNPHGGLRRGIAVLETVKPVLSSAGATLEVHETGRPGHARELAETLPADNLAGFCVIGGDGTVHDVVNGLMRREDPAAVPFGVIPAGSGNDFALHLGITDPAGAARRIVAGKTTSLDVARVTAGGKVEFCANIIGWGSAVSINRRAERWRWLGPSRYALAALAEIVMAKRYRSKVGLDGRVVGGDFFLVVACNTKFTGRGMMLAPDAEMDDGMLDVVIVRHATRRQMLRMFSHVFDGSHLSMDCVEVHRVRTFMIEPATDDVLNLDGELKSSTPASAEVVPSALRLFSG